MSDANKHIEILHALSMLKPYSIDLEKIRLGPKTDGGYIFANLFEADQTVISYGISTEYRFDREMAERGHRVLMFDHTVEGISNPHHNMHFYREGVSGVTLPEKSLFSIRDHLGRHNVSGNNLILKIDVEGWEYPALEALDEPTLLRFQQIAIEVHDLHLLGDENFRNRFVNVFRKLNENFTIFHVHANNCDGQNGFSYVSGIPVSPLLELSLIRNDLVTRRESEEVYPTRLDFPNVEQKDKLLWIYPFFPTTANLRRFEESLLQVVGERASG